MKEKEGKIVLQLLQLSFSNEDEREGNDKKKERKRRGVRRGRGGPEDSPMREERTTRKETWKPLQREGRSCSSLFGSDWTELLALYFWNLPTTGSPGTSSPFGTATSDCIFLFNIRNSTLQDKGSFSSKFGI
ncbi:uncharacterized protein LOC120351405 [Nilaparvata lugens]|uniref:uncharacterized protein LOC120351405 n=1 Tax=Nilaparvata lugens TaxID=108931 RepID=UPI00193E41FF|nr:uncharacterized protein LOC120351405 [Nilaparvata lugens]